jgi:hypothetical protein
MTMQGADDRIIQSSSSRSGGPVHVLCGLLIGCAVAAVLGSGPIAGWSKTLPDGPVAEQVQQAAAGWDQAMSGFGLARPYEWLHGLVRGARTED